MSLAIKFGDSTDISSLSGAVYFDAVTSFKKSYGGKVTEHPLEAGAYISDHFISDNPKISIEGVISNVDFSNIPSTLTLDGTRVVNHKNNPPNIPVTVNGWGSKLKQFIPDIIGQFLPQVESDVRVDNRVRHNSTDDVDRLMKDLINGLYLNRTRNKWEIKMTPSTLYDVYGNTAMPNMDNLIVTKFQTDENVNNGDGLFFSMELEQVRFVTLESAEAPKPAKATPVGRQATEETKKGNVQTSPANASSAPVDDRQSVVGNLGSAFGGGN